ncbi:MAG TPA: putative baseplate assembly protein [Thermoanaerobaculia bacterium]|jgi:hypothetical protein|nr:putative baseplate assembly protein [Thermoanaerobaculia bacterium]
MPLPRPILDDRSYEQLRDELIRRIPVYSPEWTDHNPTDPGITLLELFAFLGENLLFRFNQIPETARLEMLRLLQVPLRPAQPARAVVALTTKEPAGVLVPQGSEAKAGNLPFETLTEARVLPVEARAMSKAATEQPDEEDEPEVFGFFLRAVDALDGLASTQQAACYRAETVPPAGDGLPVDFGQAVDGMVWVAVLAPDEDTAGLRKTISELPDPAHLNLGFIPDREVPSAAEVDACPGEGAADPQGAVEWQISTGRMDADGNPVYLPLRLGGDTTRGLRQEGVVRLRLPRRTDDMGVFPLGDPDLAGTGDLPPQLDDDTAARVAFWVRAFHHDGVRFGKVLWVGANAVEVEQARKARTELLGLGTAQPDQRLRLVHRPVLASSLVLEVEGPEGWTSWREVDGFHACGPTDRCWVLDPEAGEVRFGNGLQGYPPQIGQRIRAVGYRYGGGAEGNVAAKGISKLATFASVKAANPLPAWGGADAEPIAEALARIPGELRRRDRAVTAGDFRELALMTPGAGVGRAECLPVFHPHTRNPRAAGVVSVVIWPREDSRHPTAPRPDRTLLRAVCRWLDSRRLVTTELYVIPPTYRKVAVAVGLRAKPGYGVEAVRHWVDQVIRQYLAPLPPYGPAGEGWPLGRRVHGPELEAAALQVEGVEFLEGLSVAGWDEAAGAWVPGTVELELDEVPELTEITVVEGPPAAPGEALGPVPPEKTPVPIPVLREEC